MSQPRTTAQIVKFETYVRKTKPTDPFCAASNAPRRHSRPAQDRLPLLSPLLAKCERLERRNAKLAGVIEQLVDDMLDELEGRRP